MNISYTINRIAFEGREKKGFVLDRPNGTDDFLFIHFKSPVRLLQDGFVVEVEKGACWITTPNTRHWFESDRCELVHDWFHFVPFSPDGFLNIGFETNKVFYPKSTRLITSLVRECYEEFVNKDLYWQENITAILDRLFIDLAREFKSKNQGDVSSQMRNTYENFKRLRIDLYRNMSENWDVCDMAQRLSLSRSRFTILYKSFFGISPKEDLINQRILHAKYLLTGSNMSIQEIAESCGYSNVYHFIRQFKERTGVSPGKYRK
ncbi:MAG: AraC family transcriptional regulator [Eubacteriales bacterium]|nr:AraC family transcriptional regulator [Eubacteriales bacterium]